MLQEKDKLWRMADTEIQRLKEELHEQKDREDRGRRQVNQKLKQKTDYFDHLHRDYKHLEMDHLEMDHLEKMAELRQEIHPAEAALADERRRKQRYWMKRRVNGWSSISSNMKKRKERQ